MSSCDCKYTVIVSVDNLVAWRLTSKATEFIFGLRDRVEAVHGAEREAVQAEHDAYMKELEDYERRLKTGSVDRFEYGPRRPSAFSYMLVSPLREMNRDVDRLHQLARYATAPFAMDESAVRLLNSIENGTFMRSYENSLEALEQKYLNKENQ